MGSLAPIHAVSPEHIAFAPYPIALFDRSMRYVGVSPAWTQRFGGLHLPDDLVGNSHYDVIPEMPEHWRVAHQRGLAGQEVTSSHDAWDHEGQTLRLRWKVSPWRLRGSIQGISVYAEVMDDRATHLRSLLPPHILEYLLGADPLSSRQRLQQFVDVLRTGLDEAHIARFMTRTGCSRTKAVQAFAEAVGLNDRHVFRLLAQFPRL